MRRRDEMAAMSAAEEAHGLGKLRSSRSSSTPMLRGVSESSPYMHNGSLTTLAEVVEFYDRGGGANPSLDLKIRPLNLTAEEKAAIVAFLEAL